MLSTYASIFLHPFQNDKVTAASKDGENMSAGYAYASELREMGEKHYHVLDREYSDSNYYGEAESVLYAEPTVNDGSKVTITICMRV